jgi:transcription elongation factor Elf1
MTYRETCPHCNHTFEGTFPSWISPDAPEFHFACASCCRYFDVENLPRIVWRLDAYSGTWHTSLVHRYTKIDNVSIRKFDYYK